MVRGILHVRSTIGMYGAERVILNLFSVIKNSNNPFSIFLIEAENTESADLRKKLNLENIQPDYEQSHKRFDKSIVCKLRAKIKEDNIGIVHSHDYKSLVLSIFASLFLPVKHVHHIHGALGNTRSEKLYAFIERIFCAFCSKIVTVSKQQKADFSNRYFINKNRVLQVNNGTHIERYLENKLPSNTFVITVLARFTPEKNHQRAILLYKAFRNRLPDSKLVLVGDGPLKDECVMFVKEQGLADSVQFTGFSHDVGSWLEQSNLVLISSITEGLPMSLLEAMAKGVPVISTPVGEIPNILNASNSGMLFDTDAEFIEAADKLATDKQLAQFMSDNGRDYIRNHMSVQAQVNTLLSVYQEISGEDYERCLA